MLYWHVMLTYYADMFLPTAPLSARPLFLLQEPGETVVAIMRSGGRVNMHNSPTVPIYPTVLKDALVGCHLGVPPPSASSYADAFPSHRLGHHRYDSSLHTTMTHRRGPLSWYFQTEKFSVLTLLPRSYITA